MADRAITALTEATSMTNADLFAISQGGQAKKVTWETFYSYLAIALDGHGGIANITYTAPTGTSLNGTVTVTLADSTTSTFTVTNGRGITSIAKVSTSGLVDTYRITYNDGTTSTFTVTNGRGITGFTKASSGLTDTYTISYNDSTTSQIVVDNGRGISSVTKDTTGLTDTYTVNYNDNTTTEIVVTNGRGITGITWQESGTPGDGQIHTGTIAYNDGTTSAVVITDGVKGNTGDAWYVHIKYADDYPTSDQDIRDQPGAWMGIYSGTSATAPTTYTSYTWNEVKGDTGDTGTSITGVTYTSSTGLVDTYTVAFSDGTTTTFEVTNGSDIATINKTGTSGLTDTYTVTMTDGSISTFTVTNGKGISNITMTGGSHAPGTSDSYTITFNDGDTYTFQVYNGANGTGAVSSVAGIEPQGANGDVPLILKNNGAPTQSTIGQENQLYYDLSGGVVYICLGESGGLYDWAGTGIRIDSALSTTSERPVQNAVISNKIGVGSIDPNFTATDLTGAVNELESRKVDKDGNKVLSTNDFTDSYRNKIGTATLNTTAQDLSNAINEHESDIAGKVDKETGKGLSTNDFTTTYKNKIGTATLTTTAQDLSGAVNELNSGKVAKAGDTMTGNLVMKATDIDITTQTSQADGKYLYFHDKNGYEMGYVKPRFLSSGNYGLRLNARRKINNVNYEHYLILDITNAGDPAVVVTSPEAWRKALELGSSSGGFPLTIDQGGTGGITATGALNSLGTFCTGTVGTELAEGTNVDTGLTSGYTYYSPNSARSESLGGTVPISSSGFKITQMRSYSTGTAYLHQLAIGASRNIFHRYRESSSSSWNPWIHLVRSDEIITVAHGGTGQTGSSYTGVVANVFTRANTNINVTTAELTTWGKMAMIHIILTRSINTGIDTDILVGTIANSNYYPKTTCAAEVRYTKANVKSYIDGNGNVRINTPVQIPSGTDIIIDATYIMK